MVGWLRVPWVVATCATLVVWVTTTPAVAQPRHEVELGGGFLSSSVPDNVQLPSVPTLDARAVGWWSRRWGIAGHVVVGIGSERPRDDHVSERSHLAYVQATVRYRRPLSPGTDLHVGFGWGMASWRETAAASRGAMRSETMSSAWLPAVEALVSQAVTDRFSVRAGVTGVPLIHVHPVVLMACTF